MLGVAPGLQELFEPRRSADILWRRGAGAVDELRLGLSLGQSDAAVTST